jgi:hypothetical protein
MGRCKGYRFAIEWIALNDSPADDDSFEPEACSTLITSTLIADLFDVPQEQVGKDVVRYRIKQTKPRTLPSLKFRKLTKKQREKLKGNCYVAAYKFIELNPTWTLVHGIPLGTHGKAEGLRYGHAWAEKDGLFYDPIKDILISKTIAYIVGHIEYTIRYSWDEAREQSLIHGTYGCWDETITAAFHN